MCGIYGFVSKEPIDHVDKMITLLAIEMASRGRHSWGVTNGPDVRKGLGSIEDNLQHILPSDDGSGLLIGHTRAATVGAVTVENSHPFSYRNNQLDRKICGVHNGSIYNYAELNKKYGRKLEVDSMHLFWQIAAGKDLSELEGYGATVFLLNDVPYFSRFNGGSLAVLKIKGKGIIFASTEHALLKVVKAFGYTDTEKFNLKDNNLYFFDRSSDTFYDAEEAFPVGGNKIGRNINSSSHNHTGNNNFVSNQRRPLGKSDYEKQGEKLNNGRVLVRIMREPALTGDDSDDASASAKEDHTGSLSSLRGPTPPAIPSLPAEDTSIASAEAVALRIQAEFIGD